MRNVVILVLTSALALTGYAQISPAAPARAAMPASLASSLDRLQSTASQANLNIGHMRIEKWKADNASKQQAQGNADSLQRNLSSALPGLIANFRGAPQDLNAGFKLYRNLNALYDVFASFTESAGAFGPKNDYEALAQQLGVVDSTRRELGDYLDSLTASTQSQINQLRSQLAVLQQQAATATPPKKVVVDDTAPAKKTTHKKKPTTPAGATPDSSTKPQ
jgi:hypothetical protein